jgi:hypothetical protein
METRPSADLRRTHPLMRTAEVSPHPPLSGAVAVKRVVRRGLRWYLWPFTGRVSAHNRAVAEVVEEHRRALAWMRMETERLDHDAAVLRPPR